MAASGGDGEVGLTDAMATSQEHGLNCFAVRCSAYTIVEGAGGQPPSFRGDEPLEFLEPVLDEDHFGGWSRFPLTR